MLSITYELEEYSSQKAIHQIEQLLIVDQKQEAHVKLHSVRRLYTQKKKSLFQDITGSIYELQP